MEPPRDASRDDDCAALLLNACARGDHASVRHLLSAGVPVAVTDLQTGSFPLFAASAGGHFEAVRILVRQGHAPLDQAIPGGFTASYVACRNDHLEILRFLAFAGADLSHARLYDQHAPMLIACAEGHAAIVLYLLQILPALADQENMAGVTPMHLAIKARRPDIVQILLDVGKVSLARPSRAPLQSPLSLASTLGQLDAVQLLVAAGAPIDALSGDPPQTALIGAMSHNQWDVVRFLVSATRANLNDTANPPLVAACAQNLQEMVRYFVTAGADIDGGEGAAMRVACGAGNLPLVRLLAELGADVTGRFVPSPLQVAVANSHGDIVHFLLAANQHTGVDAVGPSGCTQLQAAIIAGDMSIVRALVEDGGADVNLGPTEDYTPLLCAVLNGRTAAISYLLSTGRVLVNHGTRTNALHAACKMGRTDLIDLLVQGGALVNMLIGSLGHTVLHAASEKGNLRVVRHLRQEHGASIMPRETDSGHTPLAIALAHGHIDVARYLVSADPVAVHRFRDDRGDGHLGIACSANQLQSVRFLVEECGMAPAQTSAVRVGGSRTPLALASKGGHLDIVRYLVARDPGNINATSKTLDHQIHTALTVAVENNQLAVVRHLLRNGATMAAGGVFIRSETGQEIRIELIASQYDGNDTSQITNLARIGVRAMTANHDAGLIRGRMLREGAAHALCGIHAELHATFVVSSKLPVTARPAGKAGELLAIVAGLPLELVFMISGMVARHAAAELIRAGPSEGQASWMQDAVRGRQILSHMNRFPADVCVAVCEYVARGADGVRPSDLMIRRYMRLFTPL